MRSYYFLILFLSSACRPAFEDFLSVKPAEQATLFLAHRGGGDLAETDNSIAGSKLGLELCDGIELDIQISQDGTLWLAHDADLPNCGGEIFKCFAGHTDQEIEGLNECLLEEWQVEKLEDILRKIEHYSPSAIISLDVKPWNFCSMGEINIGSDLEKIAEQIDALARKYDLENQIFVESDHMTFLKYMNNLNSTIECHLMAYKDLDKAALEALDNDLDGISIKYSSEEMTTIDHLKEKGLTVQFWTVNDPLDIQNALDLGPTTIQTDNLNYVSSLP
ncbi:glycerophosphodiester phosphodiesterase [Jiulongibacter sp. NS-SX5]|uniref:glycerophosphodiester phosphodiesterase n=1 Tax=Jiulongibacter sp. NS-SX5 TaxID=3463854 RepID=UPI0040594469